MSETKTEPEITSRSLLFDRAAEGARAWLAELAENLDLSPADEKRTLHALRAGLHAIRDRLPMTEVLDLGAQLPTLVRGIYYEGFSSHHDPTKIRTLDQMLDRVQLGLGKEQRIPPIDVLRGVIHLLVEHVSAGEIRDVIATLPEPIAALWQDLTGHAVEYARDAP